MCGRNPVSMPLFVARVFIWISETFSLRLPLTRERLNYFLLQSDFPATKAQHLLGYRPQVTIEEGMHRTEAWLRQEGYLKR